MTIRVFYTGRDWFNQPAFGMDAAREFSTVAEGEKLVARCMARLGLGGRGSIDCFRLECDAGRLLVVTPEGCGAFRMVRVWNGAEGCGTLYGAAALKKALRGAMVDELQEVQ